MKNKQETLISSSLLVLLMTVIFTVSVQGQKVVKPNFTGVWVLDLKKSNSLVARLNKERLKKTERFASRLEIDHKEPVLNLTETFMAEEVDGNKNVTGTRVLARISTAYNTNGKGEINKLDGQDWRSYTVWKGDMIFVDRPEPTASINRTTLEFSFSKDGKELRITERTLQSIPTLGVAENEIPSMGGKSVYVRYEPAVKVDK